MSIDYNEKFLELRKKLSKISEGNSELNYNNNIYKNKLKELEIKTNEKLNIITNNFTSLKNEFISMTSNYYLSHKSFPQKEVFDYVNYKKEEDENNKNFMRNFSKKISEDINRNILDQQKNIDLKFLELENKIRNIFEQKHIKRNSIKREISLLANNANDNIDNLNLKVEEKKNEEENILLNIGVSFKSEMDNVNGLINEIKKDKENSDLIYSDKIKEINEIIETNFKKERKKREAFQKNVLGILKDTCQKLSDNFFGTENGNEEIENEEEDENIDNMDNDNIENKNNNMEENNIEEMEEQNHEREKYDSNENYYYLNDNKMENNYIGQNINNNNIYLENNDYNEEYIEENQEQKQL